MEKGKQKDEKMNKIIKMNKEKNKMINNKNKH